MKFAVHYIDHEEHDFRFDAVEVYTAEKWAYWWDLEREGIIEIFAFEISYDDWETCEVIF